MPVLRDKQQVGAVQPGGVVPATGLRTAARVAGDVAGMALNVGEQIGKVLTQSDVNEAKALAENAKITIDDKGVPQADFSLRERFGREGRKAFDATLKDRFEQRQTYALQDRLDQLAIEHDGDPEAFKLAAQAAVEGMAENVPEAFIGHWQDEAARLGRAYGAEIGHTEMKNAQRVALQDFGNLVQHAPGDIRGMVIAADNAGADAVEERVRVRGEALIQQGRMGRGELEDALGKLRAGRGEGMIRKRATDEGWTPERMAAEAMLIRSGTSEYQHMFTDANSAEVVMNSLRQTASEQTSAAYAYQKKKKRENMDANILRGNADQTVENAKRFDEIASFSGIDWATSPEATSQSVWDEIRQARTLPYSFRNALANIENHDEAGRERLFGFYKQLAAGETPDGLHSDMLRALPAEIRKKYQLIDGMMRFGGAQTITEALDNANQLGEISAAELTTMMERSNSYLTGASTPGGWKADKIGGQINDYVRNHMEDNLDTRLTHGDVEQMSGVFKSLMAISGAEPSDVLKMLTESATASMPETRAIWAYGKGQVARHSSAPEVRYRMPGDQWDQRGLVMGLPRKVALNQMAVQFGPDSPEYDSVDRPWWERKTGDKIIAMVAAAEQGTAAHEYGATIGTNKRLHAGEDYLLEPTGADETSPKYVVRGKIGDQWVKIGVVDLKADYAAALADAGPSSSMQNLETAREIQKEAAKLSPAEQDKWNEFRQRKEDSVMFSTGFWTRRSIWDEFLQQNAKGTN